jgi:hypothetical protein
MRSRKKSPTRTFAAYGPIPIVSKISLLKSTQKPGAGTPTFENYRSNHRMTTISTPLTKLFKIQHPVFLAGMNVAAGPGLAAAVTNAGGLGILHLAPTTNSNL